MQLEDRDWDLLLKRIKEGRCTPFLGAAVNDGILPLGGDIAKEWASEYDYPLDSGIDLPKVAQFIAIDRRDPTYPKELMLERLDRNQHPMPFNDEDGPLNVLAKLPLPVYLTTNYDDLLFRAIEFHGRSAGRKPEFEICRWNKGLASQPSQFKKGSRFHASSHTPVIYHLHGHKNVPESLVLTEDDYLDFLVNMSKDGSTFLPPRIQEAITLSSVMFVGYSLADINFRVLFRGLVGNLEAALGKMSVAVQLPYDAANPNKQRAEEYVSQYFAKMRGTELRVYWGTAREFARELWTRWRKFNV